MLKKALLVTTFSVSALIGSVLMPQQPIEAAELEQNQNVMIVNETDQFSTNFDIPDGKELSNVYEEDKDSRELRQLTHEEAMAYNPLHHVNTKRNSLILDAVEKERNGHPEPWLEYRKFAYKQAPYNFEIIDGKPVYNKYYHGRLLESTVRAIKQAHMNDDEEGAAIWQRSFDSRLEEYKKAPGQVPYIVGLNHNPSIAEENDVEECDLSTWEDPKRLWDKEKKMWWENPIFDEHPELLEQALLSSKTYKTDVNNINRDAK